MTRVIRLATLGELGAQVDRTPVPEERGHDVTGMNQACYGRFCPAPAVASPSTASQTWPPARAPGRRRVVELAPDSGRDGGLVPMVLAVPAHILET